MSGEIAYVCRSLKNINPAAFSSFVRLQLGATTGWAAAAGESPATSFKLQALWEYNMLYEQHTDKGEEDNRVSGDWIYKKRNESISHDGDFIEVYLKFSPLSYISDSLWFFVREL